MFKSNDFTKLVNKFKEELIGFEKRKNEPIGLFGAGNAAENVYKTLKNEGYNPVCFIDNDPKKHGSTLLSLPIVSINDKLLNSVSYIITTPKSLSKKVIDDIAQIKPVIGFDKLYVLNHSNKYKNIRDNLFNDECSKKTLDNILCAMLSNDNSYYSQVNTPNQYFAIPEFMEKQNDYFVDIGAFVGDSVEKYIWANFNIKKIWAFEPAKKQFKALEKRTKRLIEEWALSDNQIVNVNKGVGEKCGKIIINQDASGQSNFSIANNSDEGQETLEITTIDEYFKGEKIQFIKADIEGMELKMLKGAKETLRAQKPKLAICTYHNVNDLVEITDYIQEIMPNKYNFALRHHTNNFSETVLYCIAKDEEMDR